MIMGVLRNILNNTGKRTKLISICDINYNKEMCNNIRTAVRETKYAYEDIHYIELPKGTNVRGDFGCIGHPNSQGHLKIAQEVYKQLT